MKLTWFGGTTVRIHIGGQIVVVDAAGAPAGIDAAELVSGADHIVPDLGRALSAVDTAGWKPRKPVRLLDEEPGETSADCWSAGPGAMLIDAVGEPPLLLVAEAVPALGRWADGAVIALFGDGAALVGLGQAVLSARAPRVIMLAGDEAAVDVAIAGLRDQLDGTALLALEAGLALEV
jgi:hypothetical protein